VETTDRLSARHRLETGYEEVTSDWEGLRCAGTRSCESGPKLRNNSRGCLWFLSEAVVAISFLETVGFHLSLRNRIY
jgi:hypothetical protein